MKTFQNQDDIDWVLFQQELEKIIEEELIDAKKEANTEYYDHTSVVITDPNTGEVLAMASKQITKTQDGYKISDYTTNLLTGSDTPATLDETLPDFL